MRSFLRLGVLCAVLTGLFASVAGCASKATGLGAAESQVKARAQQRWDALVAGEVERAYSFLSPGTRQSRSLASYRALVRVGFWKGARVSSVYCPDQDRCKVSLEVDYVFKGSAIASPVVEEWVFADGEWWAALG